MFIGHPATAFAAKRIAPTISLGVLMLAPFLLDILWPVFLLMEIEHVRIEPGITAVTPLDFYHYPWSHSLLMAVVWGVAAGLVYWLWKRSRSGAWIVGALVVSHWVLDFIVHRPDLPLWPGGPKVGMGLWNSLAATLTVEVTLFAIGVALYVTMTRARDRIGSIGLWTFVSLLILIYAANLTSPPPPSVQAIAIGGLLQLLFPIWAWWFDRHRAIR